VALRLLLPRLFAPRGLSAWWVRTVHVEPFGAGVLRVLRMFLSAFVSIQLASGFWWEGVWRTVRPDIADCPRGTSCSRTVRGCGTDHPRVEVPVGSFYSCLTDSPPWVTDRSPWVADCPPQGRGLSARAAAGQLSPLLLVSCFRFGDRLGFVPRVGRSVVTT
jgi:hypothetical protein